MKEDVINIVCQLNAPGKGIIDAFRHLICTLVVVQKHLQGLRASMQWPDNIDAQYQDIMTKIETLVTIHAQNSEAKIADIKVITNSDILRLTREVFEWSLTIAKTHPGVISTWSDLHWHTITTDDKPTLDTHKASTRGATDNLFAFLQRKCEEINTDAFFNWWDNVKTYHDAYIHLGFIDLTEQNIAEISSLLDSLFRPRTIAFYKAVIEGQPSKSAAQVLMGIAGACGLTETEMVASPKRRSFGERVFQPGNVAKLSKVLMGDDPKQSPVKAMAKLGRCSPTNKRNDRLRHLLQSDHLIEHYSAARVKPLLATEHSKIEALSSELLTLTGCARSSKREDHIAQLKAKFNKAYKKYNVECVQHAEACRTLQRGLLACETSEQSDAIIAQYVLTTEPDRPRFMTDSTASNDDHSSKTIIRLPEEREAFKRCPIFREQWTRSRKQHKQAKSLFDAYNNMDQLISDLQQAADAYQKHTMTKFMRLKKLIYGGIGLNPEQGTYTFKEHFQGCAIFAPYLESLNTALHACVAATIELHTPSLITDIATLTRGDQAIAIHTFITFSDTERAYISKMQSTPNCIQEALRSLNTQLNIYTNMENFSQILSNHAEMSMPDLPKALQGTISFNPATNQYELIKQYPALSDALQTLNENLQAAQLSWLSHFRDNLTHWCMQESPIPARCQSFLVLNEAGFSLQDCAHNEFDNIMSDLNTRYQHIMATKKQLTDFGQAITEHDEASFPQIPDTLQFIITFNHETNQYRPIHADTPIPGLKELNALYQTAQKKWLTAFGQAITKHDKDSFPEIPVVLQAIIVFDAEKNEYKSRINNQSLDGIDQLNQSYHAAQHKWLKDFNNTLMRPFEQGEDVPERLRNSIEITNDTNPMMSNKLNSNHEIQTAVDILNKRQTLLRKKITSNTIGKILVITGIALCAVTAILAVFAFVSSGSIPAICIPDLKIATETFTAMSAGSLATSSASFIASCCHTQSLNKKVLQ